MAEHFADGVDVCPVGKLKRGEGMAEAVKGDVFGDTGGFDPSLQRFGNPGWRRQSFENQPISIQTIPA